MQEDHHFIESSCMKDNPWIKEISRSDPKGSIILLLTPRWIMSGLFSREMISRKPQEKEHITIPHLLRVTYLSKLRPEVFSRVDKGSFCPTSGITSWEMHCDTENQGWAECLKDTNMSQGWLCGVSEGLLPLLRKPIYSRSTPQWWIGLIDSFHNTQGHPSIHLPTNQPNYLPTPTLWPFQILSQGVMAKSELPFVTGICSVSLLFHFVPCWATRVLRTYRLETRGY